MTTQRKIHSRKDSRVRLGRKCSVDRRAVLGQEPLRAFSGARLVVGDRAVVMAGAVLYLGTTIGPDAVIGHNAVIREENSIGCDFRIWNNSVVDYGCTIGSGVKIHCNCYVAQFSVLQDGVFLAPGVVIANDRHPGCARSRECLEGPTICRGAQVGAHATILPGIRIGEQALIGAGSVVTKDVPPRSVVTGNPARVVSTVRQITCIRHPGTSYADYLLFHE